MPDSGSQLNFFRSFRFEFKDQDRMQISVFETKNQERIEKVIPIDFSLSGISVISRNKFEVGADITLKIQFKKTNYEIFGTIVRGHLSRETDCYKFGIQFQDQSQADILSLMDKYLIGLSKSRLKENLLLALRASSGRFRQSPKVDEMLVFLLNLFHIQGGAEEIIEDALKYIKEIDLIHGNFSIKHSIPAENKFTARLSDLFDRPRLDFFQNEDNIDQVVPELIKILFTTEHQRFVGFSDPKKSREYALIGNSECVTGYRSKLLEIMEKPCIVVFKGSKGTGKTHFSNVLREELRKKNHRSFLMNPLTSIDAFREVLMNEKRSNQVLILDNVSEIKPEILNKVSELAKDNWIIINSRKDINLPLSGRVYEFQLPNLSERSEDIPTLCHYYLRKRHSLHFHLEKEFVESFQTKKYKRNIWQLFEMLDTFSFHIMMRECIDWPSAQVYPEFGHRDHLVYQQITSIFDEEINRGSDRDDIIQNLFGRYLVNYVEINGEESLSEEHQLIYRDFISRTEKSAA